MSTLKVLSDETGGFCICMNNNFKGAFQQIDNEMSDYYMLGYTSANPDPLRVSRQIEIRLLRPEVKAIYNEGILDQAPEQAQDRNRSARGASVASLEGGLAGVALFINPRWGPTPNALERIGPPTRVPSGITHRSTPVTLGTCYTRPPIVGRSALPAVPPEIRFHRG